MGTARDGTLPRVICRDHDRGIEIAPQMGLVRQVVRG